MNTKPIANYQTRDSGLKDSLSLKPVLRLHRNESSTTVVPDLLACLSPDEWQRYPDQGPLATSLAQHLGVSADRIVITAGGDEAIDRIIRRALRGPRSKVVTHIPAFDMFPIYTHNAGGCWVGVEWLTGEFPRQALLDQLDSHTALLILVSPNNPTGQTIALEDWQPLLDKAAALQIPVLADLAYTEYAEQSPFDMLSQHSQVTLVRTFSKAWGLAGLRVGYLVAPDAATADELRGLGGPFPVSGVSLLLAQLALETQAARMEQHVVETRRLRDELIETIRLAGGNPLESQANFVLARWPQAIRLAERLGRENILIRTFQSPHPLANDWIRVTCPENRDQLDRLRTALGVSPAGQVEKTDLGTAAETHDAEQRSISAASTSSAASRTASWQRVTKETAIDLEVALDGTGQVEVNTGLGFFDHMLQAWAHHARLNLRLNCRGDLHVDDHHTIEDCGLALGAALDRALGERRGIRRFGYAYAPLDEAVARCVIDLAGRAWSTVELNLVRSQLGDVATENLTHFFQSLAQTLRCSLHLTVLCGANDHHRAEAAFKATALALRSAVSIVHQQVPSTKGVL